MSEYLIFFNRNILNSCVCNFLLFFKKQTENKFMESVTCSWVIIKALQPQPLVLQQNSTTSATGVLVVMVGHWLPCIPTTRGGCNVCLQWLTQPFARQQCWESGLLNSSPDCGRECKLVVSTAKHTDLTCAAWKAVELGGWDVNLPY